MVKSLGMIAALALLSSNALAQEIVDQPCAAEIPLTAKLVADALDLRSVDARADMLIGALSYMREPSEDAETASGAVIFVKRAGAWHALMPQNFQDEVGLYAGTDGSLALLTQHQVEGPGQSFTLVRTKDAFAKATCATIDFPAALNQPDWQNETLTPYDFDLSAKGRGTLIASADVTRNGVDKTLWFSYETRDGGRTWRKPVVLTKARKATAGLYEPAKLAPAPALVGDLTASAKGR